MPRRRVPSRRFDLESLEHRLTPSLTSLPPGLLHSRSVEVRAHPFAPASKLFNAQSQSQSQLQSQTQTWSPQGLAGLFRQVLVADLAVRISFVRLDLSISNASLLQFSAQVSNLTMKVDADAGSDKGTDAAGDDDNRAESPARATTPSGPTATSSGTRQNQQVIVPTSTAAPTNAGTQAGNPAQANSTGVNVAGQAVTTSGERNALLFTAPGARNLLLPQDRFDTAVLPPLVNNTPLALPEQQPIATGFAAAPPRPQLTLLLDGGSNAQPQPPEQEEAVEQPILPLNLEGADPVVPLMPALLDQFLEETPELSSVREWIFTAMPGNPFWAYALVAAGSAGAGWLSTRRKEKRKGEPFTPDEDDLTDGYPA